MRFWKNTSLRSQLVTIMSLLMIVVIALTVFITVTLLRGILVERIDQDIKSNEQGIAQYLRSTADAPDAVARGPFLGPSYYSALLDSDGLLIASTPSSDVDSPLVPANLTAAKVQEINQHGQQAFNVPGTEPHSAGWRAIVVPFQDRSGESVFIAYDLKSADDTVQTAALLISVTGVIAVVLASAIAHFAVTRAFGPLRRVERTAAAIAAGDLSQRVKLSNPATEIGRLSRSLNAMLAHIETAFAARTQSEQKMRRFVADASHELRTPLVTIRGFSELYRHGALESEEQVREAMGRIESEAKRMSQLVEDLLMLARIDEQRPLESRPVDLLLLGNDAALDTRASSPERKVRVVGLDSKIPSSAPVLGDEARLRQVVGNLLTNALRYTPEGSPIEIAVGVTEVLHGHSDSVIEIRDHGPGISEEDAKRVFERFYRADSSRFRETGGSGLGLAIVAAFVAQHDGSVRLSETPGGGATMSIRLPYVPDRELEQAHDDEEHPESPSSTGELNG